MTNLRDDASGERLARPAAGVAALPPSKSQALRALILSAASGQPVVLRYEHGAGWDEAGEDIQRGLDCAKALGGVVAVDGAECVISGTADRGEGGSLDVGESGFLGRVAPTCAALCRRGLWQVEARGSLVGRESSALWRSLSAAGVELTGAPEWITSASLVGELGELSLQHPSSSQELSALWLALSARGGGSLQVIGDVPSAPYLALTRDVLKAFGAQVIEEKGVMSVSAATHGPADALLVEVDASAAAVALAAGCLAGVRVEVPAPAHDSAQGDWRIVEHLQAFGCVIEEQGGKLVSVGGPSRGAELDLSGEPDLAPVLAAVAAKVAADGSGSVISGLHTLDGKESPRGRILEQGLLATGHACSWEDPVLKIAPGKGAATSSLLDPAGDHRMAFAFALLGLNMPELSVLGGECVAKSWPKFWTSLR